MIRIPDHKWQEARKWFSDEQASEIHLAQVTETHFPKGIMIDEDSLTPELRKKVQFHFMPRTRGAGQ